MKTNCCSYMSVYYTTGYSTAGLAKTHDIQFYREIQKFKEPFINNYCDRVTKGKGVVY